MYAASETLDPRSVSCLLCAQKTYWFNVVDEEEDRLIIFMPEGDRKILGATMGLRSRATYFQPRSEWSKALAMYKAPLYTNGEAPSSPPSLKCDQTSADRILIVHEQHRHRFEVSPEYVSMLRKHWLTFVGKDEIGERMEILELEDHPWFFRVQFHTVSTWAGVWSQADLIYRLRLKPRRIIRFRSARVIKYYAKVVVGVDWRQRIK